MRSREDLEKMTDEQLGELLPIGLDVGSLPYDYSISLEEHNELEREHKINTILEE